MVRTRFQLSLFGWIEKSTRWKRRMVRTRLHLSLFWWIEESTRWTKNIVRTRLQLSLFGWIEKSTRWKKSMVRTRLHLSLFWWIENPHGGKEVWSEPDFDSAYFGGSKNPHGGKKKVWAEPRLRLSLFWWIEKKNTLQRKWEYYRMWNFGIAQNLFPVVKITLTSKISAEMMNTTLVKFNDILLFLPPHSVPYKILVNFWYNRWEDWTSDGNFQPQYTNLAGNFQPQCPDGHFQHHCSGRWKCPASLLRPDGNFQRHCPKPPQGKLYSIIYCKWTKKQKIIILFIFAMWASGNLVLKTTGSCISSWKPGVERFEDRWAFFKSNAWSDN